MHGKNQDGVCHVTRNKHGNECMQNLKQHGNLDGKRKHRCPKILFVGTKAFNMKVTMRRDAFLIYVFPSPDVEPCPHKIPPK